MIYHCILYLIYPCKISPHKRITLGWCRNPFGCASCSYSLLNLLPIIYLPWKAFAKGTFNVMTFSYLHKLKLNFSTNSDELLNVWMHFSCRFSTKNVKLLCKLCFPFEHKFRRKYEFVSVIICILHARNRRTQSIWAEKKSKCFLSVGY